MKHYEFLLNKVALKANKQKNENKTKQKKQPSSSTVFLTIWKYLQIARPLDERNSSSSREFANGRLNQDRAFLFINLSSVYCLLLLK